MSQVKSSTVPKYANGAVALAKNCSCFYKQKREKEGGGENETERGVWGIEIENNEVKQAEYCKSNQTLRYCLFTCLFVR